MAIKILVSIFVKLNLLENNMGFICVKSGIICFACVKHMTTIRQVKFRKRNIVVLFDFSCLSVV